MSLESFPVPENHERERTLTALARHATELGIHNVGELISVPPAALENEQTIQEFLITQDGLLENQLSAIPSVENDAQYRKATIGRSLVLAALYQQIGLKENFYEEIDTAIMYSEHAKLEQIAEDLKKITYSDI